MKRALFLLGLLGSTSCGIVYDFDGYQGLPGGGDGCAGVNLMTDASNCGACGVDCEGGTCSDGVCSPVMLSLAKPASHVASLGEVVFVVQGDDASSELLAYPVTFTSMTQPSLVQGACDSNGFITAGEQRVYYRPQGTACDDVISCDAAPSCAASALGVNSHINGVAVVESRFFFMVPEGQIHETALSPDGAPSPMEKGVVVDGMTNVGPFGAYLMSYDPARGALWWTTFTACVYTLAVGDLPRSMVDCFAQAVPSPGLPLASSKGDIYVASTEGGIYALNPAAMSGDEPALFGGSAGLHLKALDDDSVFAYDKAANPRSLVALAHGSAEERGRIPMVSEIVTADARHPKYVFFTAGSALYRWRKPPVK